MTKEVIITLRGVQFGGAEDSAQPVEIVTPGEYYYKNGQHYLIFEETTEGFREVTHNLYKFTEDRLQVLELLGLIPCHSCDIIDASFLQLSDLTLDQNLSLYRNKPFGSFIRKRSKT